MHELSIVMSIVDQVTEVVREKNAHSVERIELEIGELAGIEWHSFDFAWEPGTRNSVLKFASSEERERIKDQVDHIELMPNKKNHVCNLRMQSTGGCGDHHQSG